MQLLLRPWCLWLQNLEEGGPQAVADPISQAWAGRQPSVNKPNPSTLNTLASLVSFFFSPKSYHVNAVYFFFFLV